MEIDFNEEPVTITFFKDITFGIVQEQVMAQGELHHIFTSSIDKKIGQKLKKISENVDKISNDKQIQKFESDYPNTIQLSK